MMKTSKGNNAKRRLDLNTGTIDNDDDNDSNNNNKHKAKIVKNPYTVSASVDNNSNDKEVSATATKTAAPTVTPDADTDKFSVGKRKSRHFAYDEDGDQQAATELTKKPRAARKLVEVEAEAESRTNARRKLQHPQIPTSRKSLELASDHTDDTIGVGGGDLYYHSDDKEKKSQQPEVFVPVHIHSNVDYRRRGDLALDQGTLRAFRFIRNNFHIPKNIETDPKYGALSGSCFEERVIRAYSLGQLHPNENGQKRRMMKRGSGGRRNNGVEDVLLVCSYCGDEGHKREGCLKLL